MGEYVVGMLRQVGRANRHSWSNHIGEVDHRYGPNKELAYVRTLCGRSGAIRGDGPKERADCGTCVKAWSSRESAVTGKETG
jgi:hypothetical protein